MPSSIVRTVMVTFVLSVIVSFITVMGEPNTDAVEIALIAVGFSQGSRVIA